jgi:hypothetical protein
VTNAADLAGAQGKLAIFIARLFQRTGVATMAEFSELLDMIAETMTTSEPGEAALLRQWAAAISTTAAG